MSNGVGLTNMVMKYRLPGKEGVEIREHDGQFAVSLPLLTARHDFQRPADLAQ